MLIKRLAFLLLPLLFILGCSALPKQVQITRFYTFNNLPHISSFEQYNEKFIKYEDKQSEITAAMFGYQSLFVLPLTITNKTDTNIEPSEYSISLHDGRDLKLIKMLTLDNLLAVKAKMEGGGAGLSGLEGQLIQSTINTVMSVATRSSKSEVIKGLDKAINDYFSFRPLYKNETRKGILCFMIDYKNEYPVTLLVKLKGQDIKLKFMPISATTQETEELPGID